MGSGGNNLLLNNDSHDNRDIPGDNADGFQISSTGEGNVLRGNRAWGNSDDGFDLFNVNDNSKAAPVVLDHNWAFDNGYDRNHNPLGDGMGFKLGGGRPGTSSESGGNILTGNLAWGNRANGFDENDASSPNQLYNNTAYDNGGYNYGFWTQENLFKDNIAFGTGKLATSGTNQHNSWNMQVSLTQSDFVSLDDHVARGPRQTDGSLPNTTFLQPSATGKLASMGLGIDQVGTDVASNVAGDSANDPVAKTSDGAKGHRGLLASPDKEVDLDFSRAIDKTPDAREILDRSFSRHGNDHVGISKFFSNHSGDASDADIVRSPFKSHDVTIDSDEFFSGWSSDWHDFSF
jgi:hypothetical protein